MSLYIQKIEEYEENLIGSYAEISRKEYDDIMTLIPRERWGNTLEIAKQRAVVDKVRCPWWKVKIMKLLGFHVMSESEKVESAMRVLGGRRE